MAIHGPLDRKDVADHIVAAHDRYLHEVVEGLTLCPFARRSRLEGRVERRFFRLDSPDDILSAPRASDELQAAFEDNPEVEIALLIFLLESDAHPWHQPKSFETWLRSFRAEHDASGHEHFYLVTFHPDFRHADGVSISKDTLVPLIRRSPDPLIQCTRASVLNEVKAKARANAPARLERELESLFGTIDDHMRQILATSIQTDSPLSKEIAENNFSAVGTGAGHREFEALIASIIADRRGDPD